jgi:hypothetical protein
MLTLALALAVGGDYTGPNFAIVRTALCVVIIAGAGLGVATVGATRGLDGPDAVTNRGHRLGSLTDGLLTGAALTILFALVAVDAPAFTGLGRAVRALLWLALAASLLVGTHSPSHQPLPTVADSDRLRGLALPTVLLAVLVTLSRVVPSTTGLDIDLALTLLLLIAAVAWMRGAQHLVDGFEVVVTVVVLSVLIELPIVLDMLPAFGQRAVLLAALLTPAIASIWMHLGSLNPELAGRPALRALAVTCLGCATLAGLVWTIGISGGDVINNLSTQVLTFLSVPIALLLVAAGSAARPRVSRVNDQQRMSAGRD